MAKRFTFRFETLLKIRRQREDERKRVVAARTRQIRTVRRQIAGLEKQIDDELRAIRCGQTPGILDMQQLIRHRYWLGRLHRGLLDAQGHLAGLEARLAQERAVLAEAAVQRRILEKLKERLRQRHRDVQDRLEIRQADEMAGLRFVHEALAAGHPVGGDGD